MSDELPPPSMLCPILTGASLARPKQVDVPRIAVIGAQPGVPDKAAESEAIACQGKQCMWYIVQRDATTGKEISGACAATMGVIALGHLTALISKFQTDPSKQN